MIKILTVPVLLIISFFNLGNVTISKMQIETEYIKNMNIASKLYLEKKKIPLTVLMELVTDNYTEFSIFYSTTGSDHKLGQTDFFYHTSRLIFTQVTMHKNDDFYLPSLQLLSFADGEFAEEFIEYLEVIITMDPEKFCNAVKGNGYVKRNPMKYFSESNNCN